MNALISGRGEIVVDCAGCKYIDAISGVYNVSYGHCHPRILKVIRDHGDSVQCNLLNAYDNPTPERLDLVYRLFELTGYNQIRLQTTGSEAVEKAIMLAFQNLPLERRNLIHFFNGFHGKTWGVRGLFDRFFDTPYGGRTLDPSACEEDLLETIEHSEKYGVVILEPVMAYYGHIFSDSFLLELSGLCRKTGTILIFDEMVTGFGRIGRNFAFQVSPRWIPTAFHGPDILVTAKGLGQGLPISAICFNPHSLERKLNDGGFSWTTATSNNPLLCAVGLESTKILVEEQMAERSRMVGEALTHILLYTDGAVFNPECIKSIGSMVFVDLKGYVGSEVEIAMREKHHILTRAHGDTLVLMPPFVTTHDSLIQIGTALKEVVAEASLR